MMQTHTYFHHGKLWQLPRLGVRASEWLTEKEVMARLLGEP